MKSHAASLCSRAGGHAVGVGVQHGGRLLMHRQRRTSHSKSVIVRNAGTTLRDSIIIAESPVEEPRLDVLGLRFLVGRHDAVVPRRSKKGCIACCGLEADHVNVVGSASSSTISPAVGPDEGRDA